MEWDPDPWYDDDLDQPPFWHVAAVAAVGLLCWAAILYVVQRYVL